MKMYQNKQIGFTICKVLFSLCFPIFYLFVNYYSRYGYDDFSSLMTAENGNIFKTINYSYMFHEGGYLGLLIAYFSYAIFSVYTYFIFLIVALYFSLIYLIKSISKIYNLSISNVDALFFTSLLISSLYIITTGRSEIWHSQMCMVYQETAVFLLLSIAFLIRKKMILACITLIVLMNCRIFWSLFSFGFYLIFLLIQFRKTKRFDRGYLIILLFMTISLLAYILAPGNYARSEAFLKLTTIADGDKDFLFSIQRLGTGIFNLQNLLALMLLSPIVLLVNKDFANKIILPKRFLSVPFLLFVSITISTSILLFHSTGMFYFENRVWYFNNILFSFMCLYYLFVLFHFLFQKKQISPTIIMIYVLIIAGYNARYYFKTAVANYPIIKEYAKEYDNRIEIIKNCTLGANEKLVIDPLPPSGILMSWGLGKGDETYTRMRNESFCKYYNKEFTLIVRKKALQ